MSFSLKPGAKQEFSLTNTVPSPLTDILLLLLFMIVNNYISPGHRAIWQAPKVKIEFLHNSAILTMSDKYNKFVKYNQLLSHELKKNTFLFLF